MDICQLCFRQGISLETQWIPRSHHDRADVLSRFIDPDDWSVHPSVFLMLDARFGPHTVDRFSSHYNSQLPHFNTKYASPGSCGVDALTQDWSGRNNWLCPPASLKWSASAISNLVVALEHWSYLNGHQLFSGRFCMPIPVPSSPSWKRLCRYQGYQG